ncbi:hypothetical protein FQA39_LY15579 [Lamprigera yunnana]|nr:hypothetical protein FQA39_LY15579 [Lamprigera yunnana]
MVNKRRCRLCGCKNPTVDLFNSAASCREPLRLYISLATTIDIRKDDPVSTMVCQSCCDVAVLLQQYRVNSLKQDKLLKQAEGYACSAPPMDTDELLKATLNVSSKAVDFEKVFLFPGNWNCDSPSELKKTLDESLCAAPLAKNHCVKNLQNKCEVSVTKPNEVVTQELMSNIYKQTDLNISHVKKYRAAVAENIESFSSKKSITTKHSSIERILNKYKNIVIPHKMLNEDIDPTISLDKNEVKEWFDSHPPTSEDSEGSDRMYGSSIKSRLRKRKYRRIIYSEDESEEEITSSKRVRSYNLRKEKTKELPNNNNGPHSETVLIKLNSTDFNNFYLDCNKYGINIENTEPPIDFDAGVSLDYFDPKIDNISHIDPCKGSSIKQTTAQNVSGSIPLKHKLKILKSKILCNGDTSATIRRMLPKGKCKKVSLDFELTKVRDPCLDKNKSSTGASGKIKERTARASVIKTNKDHKINNNENKKIASDAVCNPLILNGLKPSMPILMSSSPNFGTINAPILTDPQKNVFLNSASFNIVSVGSTASTTTITNNVAISNNSFNKLYLPNNFISPILTDQQTNITLDNSPAYRLVSVGSTSSCNSIKNVTVSSDALTNVYLPSNFTSPTLTTQHPNVVLNHPSAYKMVPFISTTSSNTNNVGTYSSTFNNIYAPNNSISTFPSTISSLPTIVQVESLSTGIKLPQQNITMTLPNTAMPTTNDKIVLPTSDNTTNLCVTKQSLVQQTQKTQAIPQLSVLKSSVLQSTPTLTGTVSQSHGSDQNKPCTETDSTTQLERALTQNCKPSDYYEYPKTTEKVNTASANVQQQPVLPPYKYPTQIQLPSMPSISPPKQPKFGLIRVRNLSELIETN